MAHWQERDLWISLPLCNITAGSKFVTSKNGKMKEHSQSSEIQGVLSYVHLKGAKPNRLLNLRLRNEWHMSSFF